MPWHFRMPRLASTISTPNTSFFFSCDPCQQAELCVVWVVLRSQVTAHWDMWHSWPLKTHSCTSQHLSPTMRAPPFLSHPSCVPVVILSSMVLFGTRVHM